VTLATQTIPLVTIIIDDPVALGLVKSIARPGTNVTGTRVSGDEELVGKRLGLLKDGPVSAARQRGDRVTEPLSLLQCSDVSFGSKPEVTAPQQQWPVHLR
jgi:hypothetical protein